MQNPELVQTVKALINAGCHYDLEQLEKLYAKDLKIVMLKENSEYLTFNYDENMQFFKNLKETNSPFLDTTAEFNYAEEQNNVGFVVVTREMDLGFGKKKIVFSLMLKKEAGNWRIFREQAVIVGDAI